MSVRSDIEDDEAEGTRLMEEARAEWQASRSEESEDCCHGTGRHPLFDDDYGTGLCECQCPRCIKAQAGELGGWINAAMLRQED